MVTKLTHERVEEYVTNKGCKLLSPYVNSQSKIRIECKCGSVFLQSFSNFSRKTSKYQCVDCSYKGVSKKLDKTRERAIQFSKSIGFKFLGINGNRVILECHCGKKFDRVIKKKSNVLGCSECHKENKRKQYSFDFDYVLSQITENNLCLLENDYVNARKRMKLLCKCGQKFIMSFHGLVKTNFGGCKGCREKIKSKGEEKIEEKLKEITVEYRREFRISECKDVRPLPLDFALFNNGEIIGLIEYNGEQHFRERKGWSNLDYTKKHDKIKRDFCKNNNIPLTIIPYWDYNNISKICDGFVKVLD